MPTSAGRSSNMDVALAGEIPAAAVISVFARITDVDAAWFQDLAEQDVSGKIKCQRARALLPRGLARRPLQELLEQLA